MKQAPWIIIILLLVALIITRECNRTDHFPDVGNVIADTIYRTDTIKGDSIPVPYPIVQIVKEDSIVYKEIPAQIDSAEVARQYYAERYYKRYPIVDDSNVFVSFDALVSENRLRWVVPYVQIKRPRVINHYTTIIQEVEQRNKYFYGFGVGRNPNEFSLTGNLALYTKKQTLYSLSFDVMNKDVYFSMFFPIN